MKKRSVSLLLLLSVFLVLINGCTQDFPDESDVSESESIEESENSWSPSISGLFSLEGLPPYANDLLNLWRRPDSEVIDCMGWNELKPIENNLGTMYYINGSAPEMAQLGVITDGTIDYCGGQWGLYIGFGPEGLDHPLDKEGWGLGRAQYETVVDSAEDAITLMNEVTSQLKEVIGEPMDFGYDKHYINLENKEEAVRTLPRNDYLINIWNITPKASTESIYFRLLVLLKPYYDESGKNQLGYSITIRLYTTKFENGQ